MTRSNAIIDTSPQEPPPELSHSSMHGEHRQWLNENGHWRDDVAIWQNELKEVLAAIGKLDTAIHAHQEALRVHAAAVRCYEQNLAEHEHALADYERGGAGADLIPLVKAHHEEAGRHSQQRDAHERIKKHHHAVMAQWSKLLRAIEAAE